MKLVGALLFASVAAAAVLKRQGSNNTNGTVQNPFAALPDLSTFGICTTECQTVIQTQQNPPSDWSTTCTPTFAAAVQSCLNCISTTLPALLLTSSIKESISNTLELYQNNCLTLATTTESVTLPTALSPTATGSSNSTSTGTSTSSSPTASKKTTGIATNLKVHTPGVVLAAALVGVLAAI